MQIIIKTIRRSITLSLTFLFLATISACDSSPVPIASPVNSSIEAQPSHPENGLTFSSDTLEFGVTAAGDTTVKTLTISHTGDSDAQAITVYSTSMDEQDSLYYSVEFYGPETLYPGESINLIVHFTPDPGESNLSEYHGTLFITHSGEQTLSLIKLKGQSSSTTSDSASQLLDRVQPGIGFSKSQVDGIEGIRPTSIQFGPDQRLYAVDMLGTIKIYNVQRLGPDNYTVIATETITLVKNMPNHNDDGSYNPGVKGRLVTGLLVSGSAANPVIYVASSDPRIGGGKQHTDTNLDTNSTILSRLTYNGGWSKLDLVRGLPRSEENHHANGMILTEDESKLLLTMGGNTNAGAISSNFALLPEFALSAAILEIDLLAIGNTTYDLPTLDDEDRPGVHDFNDPFGGNQGKNQAKLINGDPVQVYAPGFRNAYDLVRTRNGNLYSIDNGPNSGWGDIPIGEGSAACTNGQNEPGSTYPDSLHLITHKGYYAGHANPTRGNANNTFNNTSPQSPVPWSNPIECEYRIPGTQSGALVTFPMSTNGFAEYTASNFAGQMTGDLLATGWNNKVYRIELNSDGSAVQNLSSLFSNFGDRPLDLVAQGDGDIYPGTIWVSDFARQTVFVFEPSDYAGSTSGQVCTPESSGLDDDQDGFSNADEIANGTDPCSAADQPTDADNDNISDLLDTDDDNDGIDDLSDPFALDPDNGSSTSIPLLYDWENNSQQPGGIANLGFTGLMTNGQDSYLDLYDLNQMTVSGAAGVLTIDSVPNGDAYSGLNNQQYAFQFGINVSPTSPAFTAHTRVLAPFSGITPENYQSLGLFIGTGDQDNYVKLTINTGGPTGGVQMLGEFDGGMLNSQQETAPVYGADMIDLYLDVDPTTLQVTGRFQITSGGQQSAMQSFPADVSIPLEWLTSNTKLAIGVISTSFQASEFAATWDLIEVITQAPDEYTGQPSAVYRINAGGMELMADGLTFTADAALASGQLQGGSTYTANVAIDTSLIPAHLPAALFDTERYSASAVAPMSYHLPVPPGDYEVRLYFAEIWNGAFATGKRVFDVDVEGTLLANLDIYGEVGANVATMKSVVVSADKVLDIQFIHQHQNPAIKGIEVFALDPAHLENLAPLVDAGADLQIGISEQLLLNGDVSDDGMPHGTLNILWTKQSGPGSVSFANADQPNTTATFSQAGNYVLELQASDGALANTDQLAVAVTDASTATHQQPAIRINAGGADIKLDDSHWLADLSMTDIVNTGKTYLTSASIDMSAIDSNLPESIFQSERWDPPAAPEMAWRLPLSPGKYEVRLYFAEIYTGAFGIGKRVFSVDVEGTLIHNIDVFAEVGANAALMRSVTVDCDTTLDIVFEHITENPALKAIEILPLP